MTNIIIDALTNAADASLTAVGDFAGSVSTTTWAAAGGVALACLSRGTLFETHAVISYRTRRWITETRADREWDRVGSLSESEFEAFMDRLDARESSEFEKANVCTEYAKQSSVLDFLGRRQSLRRRAQRHRDQMQAINVESTRLRALKVEIDRERYKESVKVGANGVRRLMASLMSASQDVATTALMELNRIANQIDWEPFLPTGVAAAIRTRALNILRRLAGTTSLGEARNAYTQYQQIIETHEMRA